MVVIPVLTQDNKLKCASAVVEKDTAAGLLASELEADMLVILTSVTKVCKNFGKADEQPLDYISVTDAKKMLADGEFGETDMAPKIQAAIDYIGDSAIRKVLITKLSDAGNAVGGQTGTMIGK